MIQAVLSFSDIPSHSTDKEVLQCCFMNLSMMASYFAEAAKASTARHIIVDHAHRLADQDILAALLKLRELTGNAKQQDLFNPTLLRRLSNTTLKCSRACRASQGLSTVPIPRDLIRAVLSMQCLQVSKCVSSL